MATIDEARLIRKAVAADEPRIRAIRMGVRENILSDPSKVTDEDVAWYRDNAIFLVAEDAGEIAGFACANHQTGLIWALFIDPAQGTVLSAPPAGSLTPQFSEIMSSRPPKRRP